MDEVAAEAMTPQLYPVDMSALLTGMANIYGGMVEDRGITISPNIARGINVTANEAILESVLENLLDNAVSFSPADRTIRPGLANKEIARTALQGRLWQVGKDTVAAGILQQ